MTFAGNWLHDTFNNPLAYAGHEGNFQAYVNTLTLHAGQDASRCCTSSCSASASTPRRRPACALEVEATATAWPPRRSSAT